MVLQLQDSVPLVNPGVSQLCVRGDGKLLASAGWDHRVRIFGWKKLRPLAVLQYHTDLVLSVAFSDHQDPRQRLLAAGSKDQRISLWSIFNEGADTGWTSKTLNQFFLLTLMWRRMVSVAFQGNEAMPWYNNVLLIVCHKTTTFFNCLNWERDTDADGL